MNIDARRLSKALRTLRPGASPFREIAGIAAESVKSSDGPRKALSHCISNLFNDLYLDWDDRPVLVTEADNYRSVADPVLAKACSLLEDGASWDDVCSVILELIEVEGQLLSRAWS